MTAGRGFDRPKESIRWAREAIDDLDAIVADYTATKTRGPQLLPTKPYLKIVDLDRETGNEIHKLKIVFPVPGLATRRANEALQNIRNSFDQALYSACARIGKVSRKGNLHFPWCTSPSDLKGRLAAPKNVIPDEFKVLIGAEHPYPTGDSYAGGDDTIRELAHLANGKHTVGLSIATASATERPPSAITRAGWFHVRPPGGWYAMKKEIFLCEVPPRSQVNDDYIVHLEVAFDVTPPLGNIPASRILREFAHRSKSFTEKLERHCVRLAG